MFEGFLRRSREREKKGLRCLYENREREGEK